MKKLKNKIEALEEEAGKKFKSNPRWRLQYARRHAEIQLMVEKCYKKVPPTIDDLIAENVQRLKYWKTEQAYLEWAKKPCREIDDLFKAITRYEIMANTDKL